MVYESLFFKMDEGGSGIVDNDEMKRFLAFANLEMDAAARDAALTKADVTGDGKMVRWEARAKHRTRAHAAWLDTHAGRIRPTCSLWFCALTCSTRCHWRS